MQNINWLALVNAGVVIIGVPSIVVGLVYIGKKVQKLDTLEMAMDKLKHNLKVVTDFLIKTSILNFDHAALQSYSPLRFTDSGAAFVKKIGFEQVFSRNKADFFGYIESEHPKLKYDIEILAIKSIYFLAEKPYMNFLKIYLYNNPGKSLDNVALTLGIYVRDRYLAAHPEIAE